MAKKRMKKLLASALAVSMAATLLPAAVMAGPNEEMVLEQQAGAVEGTEASLLKGVMKAKASDAMTGTDLQGFNKNMKAIEYVNEQSGAITVYANKSGIVEYEGSTGQTLPFFALVLDCDGVNRVESLADDSESANSLDNGDKWPQCHGGMEEMATESLTGNSAISLWCLKSWWDADGRAENGLVKLRLVNQASANDANRKYQDISIALEQAEITAVSANKEIGVSGNTTATLTATTNLPESATPNIAWTTSDSSIATVSGSTITAVSVGEVTITATMDCGVSANGTVRVVPEASVQPEPTDEPDPTPTTKPGEINTPAATPDPSVTPEPSVTPSGNTPSGNTPSGNEPTGTPDPSGTPAPTGAPDPSGTPAPTNTPEPTPTEPVKKGDEVETKAGTVVVTNPSSKTVAFDTVDDSAATVTVPKTVKIDGVTYEVTTIKSNAFADSKKLTAVTIPSTITAIGKNAFAGCSKLKKVTVKSTKLKALKENTFKDCKALTSVSLPKSVTSIGKNVFAGCSKLKSITLKATNLKVKKGAFKGISKNAVIKVPKNKVKAYTKLLKKAGFKGKVRAI